MARRTKPASNLSREDRLKSALKANMARRKAQAKARSAEDRSEEAGENTATKAGKEQDNG